jgi:hypothetical protein
MSQIIRTTPNFAPDGFGSRQPSAGGLKYAVAASIAGRFQTAAPANDSAANDSSVNDSGVQASDQFHHHHNHDGYDEGLVHSHRWACGD